MLADEARLKVVAALVLGSRTTDEVSAATGLDLRQTVKALNRLAGSGLVEEGPDGWTFDASEFVDNARRAASSQAAREDLPADVPEGDEKVLRNFMKDGRLTHIPTARNKRRVVLDYLAGQFEPGKVYPERDVNFMLQKFHADFAALRRYLVDEEFLERREGFYWRAGGTFDV